MEKIKTALERADARLEENIAELEIIETDNSELNKEISLLILEIEAVSDKIKEIIKHFNLYK